MGYEQPHLDVFPVFDVFPACVFAAATTKNRQIQNLQPAVKVLRDMREQVFSEVEVAVPRRADGDADFAEVGKNEGAHWWKGEIDVFQNRRKSGGGEVDGADVGGKSHQERVVVGLDTVEVENIRVFGVVKRVVHREIERFGNLEA